MSLSPKRLLLWSGLALCIIWPTPHSPLASDHITGSPAAAAFKRGDFATALSEFRRLAETFPGDPDVLRFLAITLDRLERYDEAIEIFQEVLETTPSSVASRFHLGVTYYKARRPAEAAAQFQTVIRLAPQSPYAQAAEQHLTALAEQVAVHQRPGAPNRWGVYLQLAGASDDNIPAAPQGSPGDQEGARGSGYVAVDYHFLRRPDWTGTLQASTYSSRYTEDRFEGFDVDQYSLSATLQRQFKWGRFPAIVSGLVEYLDVDLDDEAYSESGSGRLGLRMSFTDTSTVDLYYRLTSDDFEAEGFDPVFSSRDADNHLIGISPTWYFSGRDHSLQLELEYEENNADGLNFNYDGFSAGLVSRFTLPGQLRLALEMAYSEYDYPDFAGPVRRETDRIEYSVALSKWFGSHVLLRARYDNGDEDSTIDSLTYRREVWGVDFSYVY